MISVTILTKNSERHIADVLRALKGFAEVIVYDTGSTDRTIDIAREYTGVKVLQGSFIGFGATHNHVSKLAENDWILSLDSDEVASDELVKEILALELNPQVIYSIKRTNYFNGRHIRHGSWSPDIQVKLYNRHMTKFSDLEVHEAVIQGSLTVIQLFHPLSHYPYEKTSDFLHKMQTYSDLFAKQYAGKRKSSIAKAIRHGIFAFIKSYLLKRGFLDGREGYIIAAYNGHTAYYKYLKLAEANKLR